MLKFLKNALAISTIYNFFCFIVSKFGWSRLYIFAKYLPYIPGDKILDLGCGPGTNSSFFQTKDYFGIDISSRYIKQAEVKSPNHKFICGNFLLLGKEWDDSFDIILMSGLLHHLSDQLACEFIEKSYSVLKKGGRLIAIENCLHYKQSWIKRKIIMQDRGEFVRDKNDIDNLFKRSKFKAQLSIEEDLLLIPYTHCIVTGKK